MLSKYKLAINILVILLLGLILFSTACGCPAVSPTLTEAQGKSFIWKVSSATTSVYLLGSIHAAKPDIYPLDSAIEDAFASARYLVVEVNVLNIDDQKVTDILLEHGVYPPGEGLRDNLSPSLYDALDEQFESFGVNIAILDSYRPWVILMTLEQLTLQDLGYLPENGIDYYFLDKAAQTKMILELETAEFQLELLYSLPDELIIDSLEYDIENIPLQEDLEELFQIWEDGDAAKMESMLFEVLTEEPELAPYYEKLFDERNFNMAVKIEEFLTDDEIYFVVVGAGHLVGENGLVNLLTEKSYAIEQLFNSD
jgi:uncharacterized protein YbaP (TraB family)